MLAGVVGEDRGNRARGRLGPVRQRWHFAGDLGRAGRGRSSGALADETAVRVGRVGRCDLLVDDRDRGALREAWSRVGLPGDYVEVELEVDVAGIVAAVDRDDGLTDAGLTNHRCLLGAQDPDPFDGSRRATVGFVSVPHVILPGPPPG